MSAGRSRRGPDLPYRPLAGAVPCSRGWLLVGGKLQGTTLAVDDVSVVPRFVEILDHRPSFEVIGLHAPVGLLEAPRPGGRACEQAARRLLGQPRAGAVLSAPARSALGAGTWEEAAERNGGMNAAQWALLGRAREVAEQMQPFLQRTVFEVHPELSFLQVNGERPTVHAKHTPEGRAERQALLEARLPGIERRLARRVPGVRPETVLDGVACLWTARRIAARSIVRLPEQPEWDSTGLRMELVR